jgi:hypothetical protein
MKELPNIVKNEISEAESASYIERLRNGGSITIEMKWKKPINLNIMETKNETLLAGLKELLSIMIGEPRYSGLCTNAKNIKDVNQYHEVQKFLDKNLPERKYLNNMGQLAFSWDMKDIQSRINWLEKQIMKIEGKGKNDKEFKLLTLLPKLRRLVEAANHDDYAGPRGICEFVNMGNFDDSEQLELLEDFLKFNLPPFRMKGSTYCWPPDDKQSRLDWLDEQIRKLQSVTTTDPKKGEKTEYIHTRMTEQQKDSIYRLKDSIDEEIRRKTERDFHKHITDPFTHLTMPPRLTCSPELGPRLFWMDEQIKKIVEEIRARQNEGSTNVRVILDGSLQDNSMIIRAGKKAFQALEKTDSDVKGFDANDHRLPKVLELLITLRSFTGDFYQYHDNGLCTLISVLVNEEAKLNNEEARLLNRYLKYNLPPRDINKYYCWNPEDKQSRVEWLGEQIAKVKELIK